MGPCTCSPLGSRTLISPLSLSCFSLSFNTIYSSCFQCCCSIQRCRMCSWMQVWVTSKIELLGPVRPNREIRVFSQRLTSYDVSSYCSFSQVRDLQNACQEEIAHQHTCTLTPEPRRSTSRAHPPHSRHLTVITTSNKVAKAL